MFNIIVLNTDNIYEYNELIKVFVKPEDFDVYSGDNVIDDLKERNHTFSINEPPLEDKNEIKRALFKELSEWTGLKPEWGILTGVRPVKLTAELVEKHGSIEAVEKLLKEFYFVSDEKVELLINTYKYQQEILGKAEENSVGVYIGIPFCPTRCSYCSFTSNQKGPEEIEKYLQSLIKEIEYAGAAMKETGVYTESLYIGGGTPTTLSAEQLDILISKVKECFDLEKCIEFTVEAGRPDTITEDKLKVISNHGIGRISINPQTMKDETLKLIGRSHTVDAIRDGFKIADSCGDFIVNADLIAGLPGETPEDFEKSLNEVIALGAENITVHTLAVKRASKLIENDSNYHYDQAEVVKKMLDIAKETLKAEGYKPYYLYRQKHMAGAQENVGYCKGDTPCIYNIRIMEEKQSILALGAGGISKKFYPAENRLERVPNVSNYEIYIERLDEMIDRKRKNFFEEV